jgi:UDP-N-acetylenolpyruvoylglucosamine reductase
MEQPNRDIILKSCTGSGKTIILTSFMDEYFKSNHKTVFIWLTPGKGNLEEQSKEKMNRYIHGSQTKLLSDIMTSGFEENDACILGAVFHLEKGDPDAIKARMNELMQKRIDKQPLDKPSAGSTFKRPAGAFAAALIDQCGLRGYRHGGAAVSDKHCGFVVNLGGATCADVLALCDEVRAIVKEKTGYDLEKEIRVVK